MKKGDFLVSGPEKLRSLCLTSLPVSSQGDLLWTVLLGQRLIWLTCPGAHTNSIREIPQQVLPITQVCALLLATACEGLTVYGIFIILFINRKSTGESLIVSVSDSIWLQKCIQSNCNSKIPIPNKSIQPQSVVLTQDASLWGRRQLQLIDGFQQLQWSLPLLLPSLYLVLYYFFMFWVELESLQSCISWLVICATHFSLKGTVNKTESTCTVRGGCTLEGVPWGCRCVLLLKLGYNEPSSSEEGDFTTAAALAAIDLLLSPLVTGVMGFISYKAALTSPP